MIDHNFSQISKNNQVVFFKEGSDYYQEYINLIINSKRIIHLQTYIFMMDEFGIKVHRELINASKRGVSVYLLVDSVGSRLFDSKAEKALKESGVIFIRFNQMRIKSPYSWGRRLHHKILVVDGEASIVGGINILAANDKKFKDPQLDFALLLRGPIVFRLVLYCQKVFQKSAHQKFSFPSLGPPSPIQGGIDLKVLVNDWVLRRWQITRQYTHLTQKAKKEITIINSYFFPRKNFMKQLIEASKRGVKVRLVLPKFSDWPSYILASEFLYSYFLKNGIEIYLWNKSILHGKLATIDNKWATIGSFNLNYTSYQQNLEMNINIYSPDFAEYLNSEINEMIISGCEKLDPVKFINHCTLKKKISRFFYYIVLATIANLSIGIIYQEDNRNEKNKKENKHINFFRFLIALFLFFIGIIGVITPKLPGIPFLIISCLLFFRLILTNKKKANL